MSRLLAISTAPEPKTPLRFASLCVAVALTFSPFPPFARSDTSGSQPDVIYIDGHILTGESIQNDAPHSVSAIAVTSGLVIGVGNDNEILRLRGPKTEVVDLHGAFAMPGFNDAHVHLASAGRTKLTINLIGVTSLAGMQQRIARSVQTAPSGAWLRGRGWDHTIWPGKTLPTRQDLDVVTGNHPAVFTRVDGHIAVANSKALRLAGMTVGSPDPAGGRIDRDAQGVPTGIVRETAMDLLNSKVPAPTPLERRTALELALKDAVAQGITSVQDYSTWDDFLVLEQMEQEGKLPIRVCEWLTFLDPLPVLLKERAHHPADDPILRTGMLKGFLDGSLGSRTAALLAPYRDDPTTSGIPQFDQATLSQMTIERAKAGFQIGFHAIGDRAVKMALDSFAAAEAATPETAGSRFRIEHIQVVDPRDIQRFRWLGVVASMQPNHLLTDMNWAEDRIGHERAKSSYPWKPMLDQGTVLAFGTDYPVEPVTPFRGLYAAVTRNSEDGKRSYYPEQAITIGHALYAYTQASAYAEGMENKKGRLVPGQFADFVVLDRDLTRATPDEILKTQVLRTVVAGKTVFEQ